MIKALFTRHLTLSDISLAHEVGIEPAILPLIGITGLSGKDILSANPDFWDVIQRARAVAFTSQNAVDALLSPTELDENLDLDRLITSLKKKPVYSVGESTADTLDEFGIMARFPEDYYGTTLAKMMQNDGVHTEVVHFCGDVRRPEFKTAMGEAGILVNEIEVYKKTNQPLDLPDVVAFFSDLKAVAFYSPSAVEAFFSQEMNEHFFGEYFAIGQTTASALVMKGVQPVIPRAPTSELLIRIIGKMSIDADAK
jgi:uroporphyrinogen-III synthase